VEPVTNLLSHSFRAFNDFKISADKDSKHLPQFSINIFSEYVADDVTSFANNNFVAKF
jgi:hypothetical protein